MQFADIGIVLNGLQTAIEIVKSLKFTQDKIGELSNQSQLVDIMEKLLASKEQLLQLREQMIIQQEKIKELEEQCKKTFELKWVEPYYFRVIDKNREGPYCQRCWDVSNKLVRLRDNGNGSRTCMECRSTYNDPGAQDYNLSTQSEDSQLNSVGY